MYIPYRKASVIRHPFTRTKSTLTLKKYMHVPRVVHACTFFITRL